MAPRQPRLRVGGRGNESGFSGSSHPAENDEVPASANFEAEVTVCLDGENLFSLHKAPLCVAHAFSAFAFPRFAFSRSSAASRLAFSLRSATIALPLQDLGIELRALRLGDPILPRVVRDEVIGD